MAVTAAGDVYAWGRGVNGEWICAGAMQKEAWGAPGGGGVTPWQ
jgi:hypothetical protein